MARKALKLPRPEEFFVNPTPNTAIEDVLREFEQNQDLIDKKALREGEDWSFLLGRAVGAENDRA
ncbi:MAG: hypothetical protein WEC84_01125 [Candidatus Andersenbacteria bacterium]